MVGKPFPAVAGFLLMMVLFGWLPAARAGMERIGPAGAECDRDSYQAAISDDGRFVAFRSNATNLVAGDTNSQSDVFVYDAVNQSIERISLSDAGAQFSAGSYAPSISDDGRVVAVQNYEFKGSGYSYPKIYVYDREAGTRTHILPVSGSDPGDREARQEPAVSGNGRFVAFHSRVNMHTAPIESRPPADDTNSCHDIYVYDLETRATERVSRNSSGVQGNGDSFSASLSDDGRYVAFYSYANNLVPDDTNDAEDVFVKDRATGAIVRVSVAGDGTQGNNDSYTPSISGNGRFVAFRSLADNLAAGDVNRAWDIFVHDRDPDENGVFDEPGSVATTRESVATDGTPADHHSFSPSISDDGRYVAFRSNAASLVPGDTNHRFDIFLRDRVANTTTRISLPASGEADVHSYAPAISGDGTAVAFESDAANLVSGDTNAARDIFLLRLSASP